MRTVFIACIASLMLACGSVDGSSDAVPPVTESDGAAVPSGHVFGRIGLSVLDAGAVPLERDAAPLERDAAVDAALPDECVQTTDSQVLCYGTVWPEGKTSRPFACTISTGCNLVNNEVWCCE